MADEQTSEFRNEEISVKISRKPFCVIEAEANISPQAAAAAYAKAVKNVKKEVAFPGFRKGKAPDAMVIGHYGPHIDKEWQEIIARTGLQEVIALTKIEPLNKDAVQECKIKNHYKEGAVVTYKYESKPEAPEINPDDIKLKKIEPKVITDKEVDEEIENLRFQHAEWTDVEGRAVKEGDFVVLDIDLLDEPKGRICADQLFHVKKGDMGHWMHKILIGSKEGDVVEGTSERDAKHESKEQSEAPFTPRHCSLTVKKIRTAVLPPIDDELAKKGKAESMEQLRQHIHKFLERQAQKQAKDEQRNLLTGLLFEKYPFELPQSLVKQELKIHLKNVVESLKEREKMAPEEIESKKEQIMNNVSYHVVRQLHLFFLTEKLFAKLNMQISRQEMVEEFVKQMSQGDSMISKDMDPQETQSRLYVSLITEKVLDHLLEKAN